MPKLQKQMIPNLFFYPWHYLKENSFPQPGWLSDLAWNYLKELKVTAPQKGVNNSLLWALVYNELPLKMFSTEKHHHLGWSPILVINFGSELLVQVFPKLEFSLKAPACPKCCLISKGNSENKKFKAFWKIKQH